MACFSLQSTFSHLTWFSQQPYWTPVFRWGNQGSETFCFFPRLCGLVSKYAQTTVWVFYSCCSTCNWLPCLSYCTLLCKIFSESRIFEGSLFHTCKDAVVLTWSAVLLAKMASQTPKYFSLVFYLRKGRIFDTWINLCLVVVYFSIFFSFISFIAKLRILLSFKIVAQMRSSWHLYWLYFSSMTFTSRLGNKGPLLYFLGTLFIIYEHEKERWIFPFAQVTMALSVLFRLN